MPAPETVPEPLPVVPVVSANCWSVKPAVTLWFAVIVTEHAPVPEQSPPHPVKFDPVAGDAVTVTCVP